MSKRFDDIINEAVSVEREIRKMSADKLSIRGWVSACLKRGGLEYTEIEDVKERLGGDFLRTRAIDSGAYLRDVRKYISDGKLLEPPAADRILKMYWSQRDGAVAELGGEKRMLFALIATAAESVYQEKPDLFGGIVDIDAHKEQLAKLESRRKELHRQISARSSWDNSDIIVGRITSDFAALISWRRAPDIAVGMGVEALIDELLDGGGAEAKAA